MSRKPSPPAMTIIVDTREQLPYHFAWSGCPVIVSGLETGDYSILGHESLVAVERKSLSDFYGCCGQSRARFERELARLSKFRHASVVIERDLLEMIRYPPAYSALNPKTVVASIVAWQIRFGVHFWPCPDRAFAEKITFRILERFYHDIADGKI